MSKELFVPALALGAGLLAMWVDVRFPGLAPERIGKTVLHTVLAFALLQLTPAFGGSVPAKFALAFLFVLPALVYALLCTLWMLKQAQAALGASR
jgi:hypothetical protein